MREVHLLGMDRFVHFPVVDTLDPTTGDISSWFPKQGFSDR
jgi:hypothetical protein